VAELARIDRDPGAAELNERRLLLRERGELSRSQRLVTDDRFPVHGKQLVEREPGRAGDNTSDLLAAPTHAHAQTETALAGCREFAGRDDAEARFREQGSAIAKERPRGSRIEIHRLGACFLERSRERRKEPRGTPERL